VCREELTKPNIPPMLFIRELDVEERNIHNAILTSMGSFHAVFEKICEIVEEYKQAVGKDLPGLSKQDILGLDLYTEYEDPKFTYNLHELIESVSNRYYQDARVIYNFDIVRDDDDFNKIRHYIDRIDTSAIQKLAICTMYIYMMYNQIWPYSADKLQAVLEKSFKKSFKKAYSDKQVENAILRMSPLFWNRLICQGPNDWKKTTRSKLYPALLIIKGCYQNDNLLSDFMKKRKILSSFYEERDRDKDLAILPPVNVVNPKRRLVIDFIRATDEFSSYDLITMAVFLGANIIAMYSENPQITQDDIAQEVLKYCGVKKHIFDKAQSVMRNGVLPLIAKFDQWCEDTTAAIQNGQQLLNGATVLRPDDAARPKKKVKGPNEKVKAPAAPVLDDATPVPDDAKRVPDLLVVPVVPIAPLYPVPPDGDTLPVVPVVPIAPLYPVPPDGDTLPVVPAEPIPGTSLI